MERKPKTSRPSFFKVMAKDYASILRLPIAFVRKYGEFLPKNAKLRSNAGKTWDVKLEQTDEKYYCFTEGWNEFVKDLKLEFEEVMLFWFNIGKSTFDFSIYGVDYCEREISAVDIPTVVFDDADEEFGLGNDSHNIPDVNKKRKRSCIPASEAAGTDGETKSGNSGKRTRPRFEVVLNQSRRSRVCVPRKFAEAAGLVEKQAVVLEYVDKQRYGAVILDQRPLAFFNLDMAGGWNDFRKENGLAWGKTYSFEFDQVKNVIQVKEKNC